MSNHTKTQTSLKMCSFLYRKRLRCGTTQATTCRLFAASPEFRSRPIRFRHVPFAWFPVVSSHLFAYSSSPLHIFCEAWSHCHVESHS